MPTAPDDGLSGLWVIEGSLYCALACIAVALVTVLSRRYQRQYRPVRCSFYPDSFIVLHITRRLSWQRCIAMCCDRRVWPRTARHLPIYTDYLLDRRFRETQQLQRWYSPSFACR